MLNGKTWYGMKISEARRKAMVRGGFDVGDFPGTPCEQRRAYARNAAKYAAFGLRVHPDNFTAKRYDDCWYVLSRRRYIALWGLCDKDEPNLSMWAKSAL